MKVFISVDMEGITGLTDPEDVLPEGAEYQRGRVFMTQDANSAIQGAFDAGATEVLVNDSHWIMRNLLLEQLDPRAKLIKGFHKPMCMVQGLDESFDAAVFVGYHSCAGTEGGVLAHTLLGKEIANVLLNGEPIGETRLNSLLAGHYGVPVVFVAGDTAVCNEAKRLLGNDLGTFAVKDGIDMFTATCLHPEVTKKGIRESVARALKGKRRKPYKMKPPYVFGIDWNTTTIASTCAYIPGIRKPNPRRTEFTTSNLPEAMGLIFAELLLALQVGQKKIYG
jgi:D-amino peptidase